MLGGIQGEVVHYGLNRSRRKVVCLSYNSSRQLLLSHAGIGNHYSNAGTALDKGDYKRRVPKIFSAKIILPRISEFRSA